MRLRVTFRTTVYNRYPASIRVLCSISHEQDCGSGLIFTGSSSCFQEKQEPTNKDSTLKSFFEHLMIKCFFKCQYIIRLWSYNVERFFRDLIWVIKHRICFWPCGKAGFGYKLFQKPGSGTQKVRSGAEGEMRGISTRNPSFQLEPAKYILLPFLPGAVRLQIELGTSSD